MSSQLSSGESAGLMNSDDLRASIRQFILKKFPAARNQSVGDHDSLLTHGIVDSLGVLEIITFIEQEFQLTVTDDELLSDRFESIARIADLVAQKLAGKEPTWTS
jgi:acyl carrier protein